MDDELMKELPNQPRVDDDEDSDDKEFDSDWDFVFLMILVNYEDN